jgi:ketosteroid isomerase-like protein
MIRKAERPEQIGQLFLECLNAGDLEGLMSLYEEGAVLANSSGTFLIGHEQIRGFYRSLISRKLTFEPGVQSVPLVQGGLALTSTRIPNGDVTAEVARKQADGSWRWVLDQPSVKAGRAI